MSEHNAEIIIIGGGPAGLTAGLYAARARRQTLLLEKAITGGQAFTTSTIENYPGFPEGTSGPELTLLMRQQAEKFGLVIKTGLGVDSVNVGPPGFIAVCGDTSFTAKAVIIASGADPKRLSIPGEAEFVGRGVSYCATCDGAFFVGKTIAVIGGGDSAVEEAIFLTKFAGKVYLVHRRDRLRAAKILQERAFANEKIEFIWNSVPEAIAGEQTVRSLSIADTVTGERRELDVSGVFMYVGTVPSTAFLPVGVDADDRGFIRTDDKMMTSVTGIFAAGDVRQNALKQVISACGEGAVAAVSAERFLEALED